MKRQTALSYVIGLSIGLIMWTIDHTGVWLTWTFFASCVLFGIIDVGMRFDRYKRQKRIRLATALYRRTLREQMEGEE